MSLYQDKHVFVVFQLLWASAVMPGLVLFAVNGDSTRLQSRRQVRPGIGEYPVFGLHVLGFVSFYAFCYH